MQETKDVNYRITFHDGPFGNNSKKIDVYAKDSDDAFKQAFGMSEATSEKYTEISVEKLPQSPSVVGLHVKYYDTVFKQAFSDYIFIKANTEQEATNYYNEHLKGRHFMHDIAKEISNGKCIRGEIVDTYFAGASGFQFDATI